MPVPKSSRTPKDPNQCPQCWQKRDPGDFIGARGKRVRWCVECRETYGNWSTKTPEERAAASAKRKGVPALPILRARLMLRSGNMKLGGIPCSVTSRTSCPPSCGFYENGCYAEYHVLAYHWRNVGTRGDTWNDFVADVLRLRPGQLWRHNVAGDLPGLGGHLDRTPFRRLVAANATAGARAFTFTHKHVSRADREEIRYANDHGFVVNLSADTLEEADELAGYKVGPVAVIIPTDTPDRGLTTPGGRRVIVCPAQRDLLTCASCWLCAIPGRKAIVGFRAHGQAAARVNDLVQLRRSA